MQPPVISDAELKPIRILVVDDHFMVRMGLSASLNVESDMEVVGRSRHRRSALAACRQHHPTLIIMDVRFLDERRR